MNKKLNKLFSATLVLMMVLSQSSNLIATLYASSELLSEQSDVASSEEVSEQLENEVQESEVQAAEVTIANEQEVTQSSNKQVRARFSDYSGIGNQNTSEIGLATYLHPNEETEDMLYDILQMQQKNSKYIAVEDLDSNLINEVMRGEDISEGIVYNEYPKTLTGSQINAQIATNLQFVGDCWTPLSNNINKISQDINPDDNCYMFMNDIGYYYNLETDEYLPIDLRIDVEYLDFFTQPSESVNARFELGFSNIGININTFELDELELSIAYLLKDGTEVNIPAFFEVDDYDQGVSMGFSNDDLYKVATYYQNPTNPSNPNSAVYETPIVGTNSITNGTLFDYVPYYEYATDNYNNGLTTLEFLETWSRLSLTTDRSDYNALSTMDNAGGIYYPEERGWNRMKFYEQDNYTTIVDSWGTNSGTSNPSNAELYTKMTTDGKDGRYAIALNTTATITSNILNPFLGIDPRVNTGTWNYASLTPYTTAGTMINKSVTDENSNQSVEIGEDLKYKVKLSNTSTIAAVTDIPVRDNLLENLPEYLTWDGVTTVTNVHGDPIAFTGDITNGTLTIDSVDPMDSAIITYTLHVEDLPKGLVKIGNIATNTTEDPNGLCDVDTTTINCDAVEIPVSAGDTVIAKSISDEDGSGKVTSGEVLNYTIVVENPEINPVHDVQVRDSILEAIPSFATFNNDVKITGSNFTGSLEAGDLVLEKVENGKVVEITYSLTINEIPTNIAEVLNIATDNGKDPNTVDPETCDETDCSTAEIAFEGETVIKKTLTDEDGSGMVSKGESLTYKIEVSNLTENNAINVAVRDSILENMPSFAVFNNDVEISSENFTGNLVDGDLVFAEIAPGETVVITYSLTINEIPVNISEVLNIATDNGVDPETVDPETCDDTDCSTAEIEFDAETVIKKSITDEDGSGTVSVGEKLTYKIVVENPTIHTAYDIAIRDSLLENMPTWAQFNDDVEISRTDFTGDLVSGDLVFTEIASGEIFEITYSLTILEIPENILEVLNIATDNGENPDTVDPESCDDTDCSTAEISFQGDTVISKIVTDEDNTNSVSINETLNYTIKVSNNTLYPANNVVVRDNLLESIPAWAQFNNDVVISNASYTGNILDGSLMFASIAPNESVEITYSLTVLEMPEDINEVINIATDNGEDPNTVDKEACDDTNCSTTEVPFAGSTVIEKSVKDEDGTKLVSVDETLTYTIKVTNKTLYAADNVAVRDSLLENTPTWAQFNNDVAISNENNTGDITAGTLVFATIQSGETVEITYSLTIKQIPNSINEVLNIATDNGIDPNTVDKETCDNTDCSSTSTSFESIDISIVETGNKVIAIIISSILVLIALLFAKRQVSSKL